MHIYINLPVTSSITIIIKTTKEIIIRPFILIYKEIICVNNPM